MEEDSYNWDKIREMDREGIYDIRDMMPFFPSVYELSKMNNKELNDLTNARKKQYRDSMIHMSIIEMLEDSD